MKILHGDCIEEMKKLEENSVDAIITDPPYGIGFMGKEWDNFKPNHIKEALEKDGRSQTRIASTRASTAAGTYDLSRRGMLGFQRWFTQVSKECLRVLKPGGFLLSFGGTRTYHRMTCGIEDAGFEIRDTIMWLYASGFPKSLNVKKQLEKVYKGGNTSIEHDGKQETKHNMRQMSEEDISKTLPNKEAEGKVLQSELSEQSSHKTMQGKESQEGDEGKKESSMEGRSNLLQDKGKLQRCEVCKMSKEVSCYVSKGWLYHGTQINNGKEIKKNSKENRSNTPHRPQSREQQDRESYAICEQCRTQILREWEGWGTALKPACEPIVVARKPLSEKNVALNVLKHGTGGLNIDECRVNFSENDDKRVGKDYIHNAKAGLEIGNNKDNKSGEKQMLHNSQGRFPANIILDEEAGRLLDEQSGEMTPSFRKGNRQSKEINIPIAGNYERKGKGFIDKGGASRFFYCAKASKSERNLGCEDMEQKDMRKEDGSAKSMEIFSNQYTESSGNPTGRGITSKRANNHPTVKPIKLMRYLVKLVVPKGGNVLDPFGGSGSTAIACIQEGIDCTLIEKEEEYVKIANARIKPFLEQSKLK